MRTPAQLAADEKKREAHRLKLMEETKSDETTAAFQGLTDEQKAQFAREYAAEQGLELVSKAVAKVVQIDPATPDNTDLDYMGTGFDPWMGAIIEPGWHHVKVTEHPVGSQLPSNKLKFSRMGYKVAPAPPEVAKDWEENRSWVMRIPQKVYDQRVEESKARSRSNRAAAHEVDGSEVGMVVTKSEQGRKSLAELLNG